MNAGKEKQLLAKGKMTPLLTDGDGESPNRESVSRSYWFIIVGSNKLTYP